MAMHQRSCRRGRQRATAASSIGRGEAKKIAGGKGGKSDAGFISENLKGSGRLAWLMAQLGTSVNPKGVTLSK